MVKELENSLVEKYLKIKNAETNLAEAQLQTKDQAARIFYQDKELEKAHSKLKEA
jgi:hypothetical protein